MADYAIFVKQGQVKHIFLKFLTGKLTSPCNRAISTALRYFGRSLSSKTYFLQLSVSQICASVQLLFRPCWEARQNRQPIRYSVDGQGIVTPIQNLQHAWFQHPIRNWAVILWLNNNIGRYHVTAKLRSVMRTIMSSCQTFFSFPILLSVI